MAQDYTLVPGQQVRVRFSPFSLRMLAQLDQSMPPHNVYFVDSTSSIASTANTGAMDAPLPTWTSAYSKCTTAKGDRIILMPGHTETFTGAAGLTLSKSDVVTIGLGEGQNRPRFTFGTSTAASVVVSGANNWILNVIGIAGIDGLTNPFHIQAAGFTFDIEWQDGSSTVEAARAMLTTAAADRLRGYLRYVGFTAGDACVNAIRMVGVDGSRVEVDTYGKASTAWVEFHTTACTDVRITGSMYNSGTTDGTKDIVDTVTGSTWSAEVFDATAGTKYSGGSGKAWATDPSITAVTDALYGTTGIASWLTAAAYANNVSLSEVIAYIQDAVRRGAGTILPANTSLYDLLAGTNGIPSAFTTAAVPASGVSMAAVLREIYDQAEKAVVKAAATLVNGTTIFTIAGGPITILELYAYCATANDGTATTLQFSSTPTLGTAKTISGASASLASVIAGTSVVLNPTALTTAPDVVTAGNGGVQLGANVANRIIVNAGTLTIVVGVGSTTGTWTLHLRYRPLSRGVTVV